MKQRLTVRPALVRLALLLALLGSGGAALAQSSDLNTVREASQNGPPREAEGQGAAAALNADIIARNAEAAARDRAADEEYARKQREFEARKKADAAAYARALADYEAKKAAVERQRQADLAAWQARVAACKAGDRSACAPQ